MAGGPVILPADPWERSDVTEEKLQSLVEAGLLRPITDPDEPEWIAPGSESEPRPRDGYVVSFTVFHERGLGSPADSFMRALPHYYGVELQNFSPNSIAQAGDGGGDPIISAKGRGGAGVRRRPAGTGGH